MLSYNQLIEIITDNSQLTQPGIQREIETELETTLSNPRPIKIITGIRRSGKSFLLKRLYKKLIAQNIPAKNILFLNFEDDRLYPYLNLADLRKIYDLFISETVQNKPIFLFFDEIQNITGWEKFIRTIYDTTNHNIFITGSNSQLLSGEFSMTLGGRVLEMRLFPFSLLELLKFNGVEITDEFSLAKNRQIINKLARRYLTFGGFAEVQTLNEKLTLYYRRSLIEKIVIKDIISRYKIDNPHVLEKLIDYLEKNIGNIISFQNLARITGISDKTIENYLNYLQNAFIGHLIYKFSWKTKEIFTRQKKFFFIDNLFTFYSDIEDKLENFVFSHLARYYNLKHIFFGRNDQGKEIDFLVKTEDNNFIAIQVCAQLTDQNFTREISSLKLFDKYIHNKNTKFFLVYIENNSTKPLPQWITPVYYAHFPLTIKKLAKG